MGHSLPTLNLELYDLLNFSWKRTIVLREIKTISVIEIYEEINQRYTVFLMYLHQEMDSRLASGGQR